MFIKVTQSGGRRYAQLVESFRNDEGKPRQRTVCTLGRLESGGDVDTLIASLQRARGIAPAASALDDLRFTDSRHAGDIWALSELWRTLGFDDLATSWRRSKTEIDVLTCLRLMVFNRLCDPGSKLGVLRWLQTVALPAGSGIVTEHQHLLRAMDVLDEHSDKLKLRLATLMRPLIDQDLSVVFYDLTTVAVTGQTDLQDDVRAYGLAKSGLIERQFMLSLVQTCEGLPIAHEVHPGNTAEAKTLLPMIRGLLVRYPLKRVVLIADRGLLSTANIEELDKLQAQLKKDGRDVAVEYILAVPAARYGDFADDLQKLHKGQDATQEWCVETKWSDSRLVVAHDPVAANRRTTARDNTMAELLKLGQQCSVKLDAQDESQRAGQKNKSKGRPMSDSGTKARFYHAVKDAHMAHLIKVDLKADLFSYSIDEDKKRYLELLDGKLLLVTNTNAPAAEVVQRYKSLADIERGFRVLKSDIEIGPVYHRLPQRIRAHALICFMALVLYRVMRMRLKAAKRSESPSTLLESLKRIHQQTVQSGDGKTLAGLTEITPAQKSLFTALDLTPPTPSDLAKPVL
ncbi:IS1634 family transposase [Rhodoferax antarcticus]|uniref:Transposase DDE domain protein n=1 Tax=Rhodoferax antarcticus ANT.BR TaxID=1111071 RepID=A0A1Q8YDH7_9BURK|nr:IS1634 family transposase [Rhodoferax antarcticus]OLP05890.1 transposase DDE domain protein [Rhodoferax antarcticus ANT.BR]